jgi:hypothetical protein
LYVVIEVPLELIINGGINYKMQHMYLCECMVVGVYVHDISKYYVKDY